MAGHAPDVHEPLRRGGGQGAQGHWPYAGADLGRLRRARPPDVPDAHQAWWFRRRAQRRPLADRVAWNRRLRPLSRRHRQAVARGIAGRAPLRPRAIHEGGGAKAAAGDQRSRRRAGAGARRRSRTGDGPLQPRRGARLRGIAVTPLWQSVLGAEPRLEGWVARGHTELHVARLPRSAWPIVAGAVARALTDKRKSAVILVQDPERFAEELRLWLNGQPPAYVFAEVRVSFLDRPPAFDESVNRRLEALAALASADRIPAVVVSSRRALTRQTISRRDLGDTSITLRPGEGPDPIAVAGRLVELGYTREALVEERGQFSLRGGILDVFGSAEDAPVRAEWSGDVVDTLRLFDPENQRSVMAIEEAVIRTGRELLIGPERGRA